MRLAFTKGAAALGALLVFTVASVAANLVQVQVVDNGVPVQGVPVSIMASNGQVTQVTNADGMVSADLNGNYYRLKVNGVALAQGYVANGQTVVIDLND
jgi:uncharacterized protein YfaS (alpha-2-macroglobulin family)